MSSYEKAALQLATAALNKILKFNLDRTSAAPRQTPPGGLLYHYTTVDGLQGIVGENCLRATSAYFLNDSTEITYGCKILARALDEWARNTSRSEGALSLRLLRDLRQSFGEDPLKMSPIRPVYLACFCEDDNLLSQWRAYGQAGGYSIGFAVPSDGIVGGMRPEPNIYTAKWLKVEYDEREQAKKCEAILEAILPVLDEADTARALQAVRSHPMVGYAKFLAATEELLLDEIVGFKNNAFDVEREWRIVVRPRELLKQATDDGGKKPAPVYFRSVRGALVPYVKLVPVEGKLPIASVRSGPTLDRSTAALAVQMLLERNRFHNVRVQGSEIPVRFNF
jgi:Protein of unknown function (DUF2971)